MEFLKSFLCASAGTIVLYIFDVILILAAIVCAIVLYIKYGKNNTQKSEKESVKSNESENAEVAEKIDDDTYVLSENESNSVDEQQTTNYQTSNRVEHFASQMAEIDESDKKEDLSSNAVVVNREVEGSKNIIEKQDIKNYVVVEGVKKEKTQQDKVKSINRGTGAYDNATNFVNVIKDENQAIESVPVEKKSSSSKSTTKSKKSTSK